MPTTYNGVGTHYYGKRNVEKRVNVCQFCGRESTLTSYDTRLWVVILFIPVFPLERKRIIDYCSSCTRHYAVNLQKWQTAGQLETSGAAEQYRTTPTAENAIALHQQLVAFNQNARAEEMQKELAEKFSSNAKVQAYLGASLAHQGKHDAAALHFQRALELRPDLPEARIGMGMELLKQNRLDDAQQKLDLLDKPGAGQLYSLEPLELLGNAFQAAGRHEDALRCFQRILTELPQVAQYAPFRKKIAKSEKALGRKQSTLPKKQFSWRNLVTTQGAGSGPALTKNGLAAFAVVAAIVIGAFVIGNIYIKGHRTIYIVNGLPGRETVTIDGKQSFPLAPHAVQEVTVAEGSHTAKFEGAHSEEVRFEVRVKSYFSRWFDHPVWVLNPGGAAILMQEAVTYSQNPVPSLFSFRYGRSVEFFPEVTHPFRDLPDTVKVSSRSESVLKTHLEELRQPPVEVFDYLVGERRRADALAFAEFQLKRSPSDEALLRAYLTALAQTSEYARALPTLESGLTNRPISIEWHRAYQGIVEKIDPETNILSLYDTFLAADPTNSALMYLRGRLLDSPEQSRAEFQRAAEADPTNAFAINGLGYYAAAHGDWPSAKNYFAQAVKLDPKNEGFWSLYNLSRMALAEYDAVENDLRERMKKDQHLNSALLLVQLLASQNKTNEADLEITAIVSRFSKNSPQSAGKMLVPLQRIVAYSSGNFEQLQNLSANDPVQLHISLVEQNKLAEAEANLPKTFVSENDPYAPLVFSLAWNLAGNSSKAGEWASRGTSLLEHGSKDERAIYRVLRKAQPPTDAELFALTISPRERAIIAALLYFQHPSEASRFAKWVQRFNIDRAYPYHLLNRVAARAGAAGAGT
jgi:tetratricopeptide (TPR) repeat protein